MLSCALILRKMPVVKLNSIPCTRYDCAELSNKVMQLFEHMLWHISMLYLQCQQWSFISICKRGYGIAHITILYLL